MALLSFGYVVYHPIRVYLLVKNGDLEDEEFKRKYGGVYEVYKEREEKTAAFEVVVLVKKFLIAFSLVFLGAVPLL